MYYVGYFNHGTALRFIMLLVAGAFLGAIPVAVLLAAHGLQGSRDLVSRE